MNIAICDDDWSAVCTIKRLVDMYMSERVIETNIYTFKSGKELLDAQIRYDIVFLDIEMPGINGLEVHKKLKDRYMDTIDVFITSHDSYIETHYVFFLTDLFKSLFRRIDFSKS